MAGEWLAEEKCLRVQLGRQGRRGRPERRRDALLRDDEMVLRGRKEGTTRNPSWLMPRACWATLAGCTILGVRRIGIAGCLLIKHVASGPELLDASGWARRRAPAVLVTIEPHQAAHQDNHSRQP
jgi:hypothetical protein